MHEYCTATCVAAVLTFFTLTILFGINEVARELDNPFRNVPNELPVVTLQAQFNEALIVMFAGYHPDSYWQEAAADELSRNEGGGPFRHDDVERSGEASQEAGAAAASAFLSSMQQKWEELMSTLADQSTELQELREKVLKKTQNKRLLYYPR